MDQTTLTSLRRKETKACDFDLPSDILRLKYRLAPGLPDSAFWIYVSDLVK